MREYNGIYKHLVPRITMFHRAGLNPSQICHRIREDRKEIGIYGPPYEATIRYIIQRSGLNLNRRSHGDKVQTRLWFCLKNAGLSLEQTTAISDRELLRIPNFGRKCLERLRELSPALRGPQNPEYRFEHLSEAPIG